MKINYSSVPPHKQLHYVLDKKESRDYSFLQFDGIIGKARKVVLIFSDLIEITVWLMISADGHEGFLINFFENLQQMQILYSDSTLFFTINTTHYERMNHSMRWFR